jgi:hypothetical protein
MPGPTGASPLCAIMSDMIIGDRIRGMRIARALECPLYQLFYEGEEAPKLPNFPTRKSPNDVAWGSVGKEARYLNKLRRLLSKSDETDRKLLLQMAQKMALRHPRAS